MSNSISYLSLTHGAVIGACLLIALMHVLLLFRGEMTVERIVNGTSVAVMALAAAAVTFFELEKAFATDVYAFIASLRGEGIAVVFLLTALLVFVRSYFERSVDALFLSAIVVMVGGNVFHLMFMPDSFFSDIGGLVVRETTQGEAYVKLVGTISPLKYIVDAGSLLVFVYILVATLSAIRQKRTRSAIIVGGSTVFFMLVAGILVPMDDAGLIDNTMPLGWPFLAVVAALTYQIISDRAQLSDVRLEVEQLRRSSLAGEIAAGLMHELRQPLTSILSNAQAALRFLKFDPPDIDEVQEALDDIVQEDKRAAEIIVGLRSFLVQRELETSEFDINTAVRRVARILAGEFHAGRVRLEAHIHPSPLLVNAVEVQLEQVLINLAVNALRAMREKSGGERVVRFTTTMVDGQVEFSVADSGPGIAADMRDRLFEPFASGSGGPGMGLAICQRIVDSHDGTMRIENTELGGARFAVTLPLSKQ